MSIKLVSQVSINNDTKYEIKNKYNCGQIVINIDESQYTEQMSRELTGILFRLYIKVDDEYIPYNNKTVLWNPDGDISISMRGISKNLYVSIEPLIDDNYLENNDLQPTEVFPISVYFDSEE